MACAPPCATSAARSCCCGRRAGWSTTPAASTRRSASAGSTTSSCPTRTTTRSCSARPAPSGSPPRSGARSDLVDAREAGLEAAPRGAQVEPPHAHALRPREPRGLVYALVQPPRPVAQRLRVVGRKALDVVDRDVGLLERRDDP